jgi:hypothetical protein
MRTPAMFFIFLFIFVFLSQPHNKLGAPPTRGRQTLRAESQHALQSEAKDSTAAFLAQSWQNLMEKQTTKFDVNATQTRGSTISGGPNQRLVATGMLPPTGKATGMLPPAETRITIGQPSKIAKGPLHQVQGDGLRFKIRKDQSAAIKGKKNSGKGFNRVESTAGTATSYRHIDSSRNHDGSRGTYYRLDKAQVNFRIQFLTS